MTTYPAITFAFKFIAVWFATIVFHELGHYLFIKALKKECTEPKLKRRGLFGFEVVMHAPTLTTKEYKGSLAAGVLAGFLPIVPFIDFHAVPYTVFTVSIILLYLSGCLNDIRRIVK